VQHAVLGGLAALARVIGRRPDARPEFDRDREPLG
jgi:hypothetical protein